MKAQIVLINSANCELERLDVEAANEEVLETAFGETLRAQLNDLNWLLNVGDTIRIEALS